MLVSATALLGGGSLIAYGSPLAAAFLIVACGFAMHRVLTSE